MSSVQQHIIDKVFFEVNTKDEKTAMDIKNIAGSYLQEHVLPALDELLSKYDFNGQTLRFESLNIYCNMKDWNDLSKLKIEFYKTLRQELELVKKDGDRNGERKKDLNLKGKENYIIEDQQNLQSTFLHFLEKGYLPWFGKREYINEITKPLNWNENLGQLGFRQALKKLLAEKSTARERLVIQFPDKVVLLVLKSFGSIRFKNEAVFKTSLKDLELKYKAEFLGLLLELSVTPVDKYAAIVQFVNNDLRRNRNLKEQESSVEESFLKFLEVVNQCFTEDTVSSVFSISNDEMKQMKQQCLKMFDGSEQNAEADKYQKTDLKNSTSPILQGGVNAEKKNQSLYFKPDENEIVLQNAGLVLFIPFLQNIFERIDCLNQQKQIKHSERTKAIQTLSFLADGNDTFFEGNLMFEKFLCGVPLSFPINKNSHLTEAIKDDCNSLLLSLIHNWTALKNTSPNGLRQMFVQRPGKLIKIERGFRLIVERRVQDILLEKLPWNISIVKLPWNNDLLFVEW